MWIYIAASCSITSLLLVLRQFRVLRDFPTRCLLIALWLRYVLQAFPSITVEKSVAGFSIISIFAILTAGLLATVVDFRLLRLRSLISIYLLISWVLISSIINQSYTGLLIDTLKWMHFLGILLLTYRAIVIFGLSPTMYAIIWTFFTPMLLQLFAVALAHPKLISDDGSVSYIGGYSHESVFSVILFSFVCVATFVQWKRRWAETALVMIGVLAIFLTSYRTTIIATIPILLLVVLSGTLRLWLPRFRPAARTLALVLVVIGGVLLWHNMPDRYADVAQIFGNLEILTQPPQDFSDEEKRLFSGRVVLWAEYTEAYIDAKPLQRLIGFGAHAYEGRIRTLAHNTFVSYLYEFGAVGLLLLIFFLVSNLLLVFKVPDVDIMLRLAAAQTGFIILNLTTMPLWSTEGMTIYALLLAPCWALQLARPARRSVPDSLRRATRSKHP